MARWLVALGLLGSGASALAAEPAPPIAPSVDLVLADPIDVLGGRVTLRVELDLAAGRTLSRDAPHTWSAASTGGVELRSSGSTRSLSDLSLRVPMYVGADGDVDVELVVYHCAIDDCQVDHKRVTVPVRAGGLAKHARVAVPVGD